MSCYYRVLIASYPEIGPSSEKESGGEGEGNETRQQAAAKVHVTEMEWYGIAHSRTPRRSSIAATARSSAKNPQNHPQQSFTSMQTCANMITCVPPLKRKKMEAMIYE